MSERECNSRIGEMGSPGASSGRPRRRERGHSPAQMIAPPRSPSSWRRRSVRAHSLFRVHVARAGDLPPSQDHERSPAAGGRGHQPSAHSDIFPVTLDVVPESIRLRPARAIEVGPDVLSSRALAAVTASVVQRIGTLSRQTS